MNIFVVTKYLQNFLQTFYHAGDVSEETIYRIAVGTYGIFCDLKLS